MARRLELALVADRPPAAPDKFVPMVLQRVRRERWRMEQNVDRLFNVAIVVAFVIVAVGALALMNLSGVLAAAAGASTTLSELSGELAHQMEPALNTYIAAAGLLLTALGMWWWAERRISF
jgi:divalent metal cation (Fe/Co/Zn/Cd) transporter